MNVWLVTTENLALGATALSAAFATPQATFEAVACDLAYAVRRANLHGSFCR